MTHRRLSWEGLAWCLEAIAGMGKERRGIEDHIAALESELAAVKAELAEALKLKHAWYELSEKALARVRELEEALQFVLSHQTDPNTAYSVVCRKALGGKE